MSTPVYLTGFEHGIAAPNANGTGLCDFVNGVSVGVMSIVSSQANTGTYSLKCAPDGVNTGYMRWTISGTPNVFVMRFYLRIETAPAGSALLAEAACTTSTFNPRIYIDPSTTKIQIRAGGATVIASSVQNYTLNQWMCVDLSFNVSANPWVLKAQMDGQEFSGNSAQAADTFINTRVGAASSAARVEYYDDIIFSVTAADYPIGPGGTEILLPTSDGTHNAGTNIMENQAGTDIGVVTAYDLIDDIPMTTATTYIRQAAIGTGNYAEILFGNIQRPDSAIIAARGLLAYTSETTTSNRGACIISKDSFSTSTTIWGDPATTSDYSDGSTANLFYKGAILGNVINTNTVNALAARMGYSGDATPDPYWVNLAVEVAYALPRSNGLNVKQAVNRAATY